MFLRISVFSSIIFKSITFTTRNLKWSKKKIWRFFDSAGTKTRYLHGTNCCTLLFSKNLVVHILFDLFLYIESWFHRGFIVEFYYDSEMASSQMNFSSSEKYLSLNRSFLNSEMNISQMNNWILLRWRWMLLRWTILL